MPYRLLDLFAGRFGWSKAFAARGWECIGVDLVEPAEIPQGCRFIKADVITIKVQRDPTGREAHELWCEEVGFPGEVTPLWGIDFICASSPCEQFSVHGMKHFHPNPPYPELGIKLFNHTRLICEASGVPYVMENVRAAQEFVGQAANHCGPFYLWGNAVPPLLNQGIKKGLDMARDPVTGKRTLHLGRRSSHNSKARARDKSITAEIPPEISNCVADYAERILEIQAVTDDH